jgi:hypothetical protein
LPVDPPPPSTSARRDEEDGDECERGVEFMGVASRSLRALPRRLLRVARSWTAGERPLRTLLARVSPPCISRSRSHDASRLASGTVLSLGRSSLSELA